MYIRIQSSAYRRVDLRRVDERKVVRVIVGTLVTNQLEIHFDLYRRCWFASEKVHLLFRVHFDQKAEGATCVASPVLAVCQECRKQNTDTPITNLKSPLDLVRKIGLLIPFSRACFWHR